MTPFPNPDIERVRISGAGQAAAAVPHLLGFRPEDSLVVLCITRPRHQVGLTMRFDVSGGPSPARLAAQAAVRAEAAGADEVMLVCYPRASGADLDVASRHDLPRADLLEQVCLRMAERHIGIQNAVVVCAGRWRSYLCDDECCASSEPLPDVPPQLAVATAWRGQAVLPDRGTVVASLSPLGGRVEASMKQAYLRQRELVLARLRAPGGADGLRRDVYAAYRAVLARFGDPRTQLADDETAFLVLSLNDVRCRDAVATRALDAHEHVVAVLTYLARRAYPPDDAPVCTTLAWVLCMDGAMVRARIALERAVRSDPAYSLAVLLGQAIEAQIPPSAIRALTRQAAGAARDDAGSGRGRP